MQTVQLSAFQNWFRFQVLFTLALARRLPPHAVALWPKYFRLDDWNKWKTSERNQSAVLKNRYYDIKRVFQIFQSYKTCVNCFFLRLGRKQKSCDKQTDLCEVVIHSLHPAIAQRLPQAVVAIIGDEWWWQLLLLSLLDWFRYVQIFVLMLRTQEKHERFEGPQKCLRLLSEPTCLVGKCWFQRYLFTYILQPLAKLLGFMQSEETLPGQTWSNQIKSHWYCPMMSYDVMCVAIQHACSARRMRQRRKFTCLHILLCRTVISRSWRWWSDRYI